MTGIDHQSLVRRLLLLKARSFHLDFERGKSNENQDQTNVHSLFFMIAFSTFCTSRCVAQGQAQSTPVRDPNDPKLDIEIVDALNTRFGTHPGFRANHAKGIVVEGTFTPTREAAELSRSPIFAGATLPVTASL